jgi:glycosyltransferase involved in cell wall biosynthesis
MVLDDPDNTAVRNYLKEELAHDKSLTVIHNEQNLGLGASLNKAVAVATGDLLARVDLDDWLEPTRLEKQLCHFVVCPKTDLLFTQWCEHYEDGSSCIRQPKRVDVQCIRKNFFTKSLLLHPSMMIRKQILIDHPYPTMSRPEDFVLFLKLIRSDYNFDLLEQVLYHYQVDRQERYKKIRIYSANLLPHLIQNFRYYWKNPYYYLYLLRISIEYLFSRNHIVFNFTHQSAAKIWKFFARSK